MHNNTICPVCLFFGSVMDEQPVLGVLHLLLDGSWDRLQPPLNAVKELMGFRNLDGWIRGLMDGCTIVTCRIVVVLSFVHPQKTLKREKYGSTKEVRHKETETPVWSIGVLTHQYDK